MDIIAPHAISPDTLSGSAEPIGRNVAELLRHAIVTMRLKPGEKLSEHDVARRLGVSRQPVREAFIKLAEAGLVRILPQRGTLVTKISMASVTDARFIREAIECAVVREAANHPDPRLHTEIRGCLDLTERAMEEQDAERFFALDEEFHQLLARAAGRPTAWRVIEEQKAQMDRVRYLDIGQAIPMRKVLEQHRIIADAVTAGDPAAAEAAMRDHLSEILRSLPRQAMAWPDLFEDAPKRPPEP